MKPYHISLVHFGSYPYGSGIIIGIGKTEIDDFHKTLFSKSYSLIFLIEELQAWIAESERQYAAGMWQDFDEAIDEIEAELEAELPYH